MSTAERLQSYYPFDQEVIDTVAEVADRQRTFSSYDNFFSSIGVGTPQQYEYGGFEPTDIVDIRPKEHDPKSAMLIHLAMANPLDPNQLFQIGTIAAANPNTRIIAAGNPSGGNYKSGHLNWTQVDHVKRGHLWPTVAPLLRYAERNRIESADNVGYSYGVDRAIAAINHPSAFETENLVLIEPASAKRRLLGSLSLGLAFLRSNGALGTYTKAPGLEIFDEARHDPESMKMIPYLRGLLYPTNRAIAKYIADGHFEPTLRSAIENEPWMATTVAWGTKSELGNDYRMEKLTIELEEDYGPQRIRPIRIKDARHALANDVHLQAAIVNQALLDREAA